MKACILKVDHVALDVEEAEEEVVHVSLSTAEPLESLKDFRFFKRAQKDSGDEIGPNLVAAMFAHAQTCDRCVFPPKTRTQKQGDNVNGHVNVILHKDSFVKMKVFLKILPVTLLAEVVCGQFCTKETLDCSEAVPAITKLGSHSCACDNEMHSGALKFDKGNLYFCSEKEWKLVGLKSSSVMSQKPYGSHRENPGRTCDDILAKAGGKALKNGIYWIRVQGNNNAHVSLLQCYLIFFSLLVRLVPLACLNMACIFLILVHVFSKTSFHAREKQKWKRLVEKYVSGY